MQIYEPAEDSYLLQRFVRKYAIGRVLDMGTGSGIQALTAIESPNVREVVAVDINEEAIKRLNEEISEKGLRKIKAIKSDLFENVEGHFNLIIFNPPYLPQDKGIKDPALFGGKKGWELSERFFKEVSKYLFPDGVVLFLFSNLTNKERIDEIISKNMLEFEELASERMPMFEELYVYLVRKSSLLRELEAKSVENVHYFAKGKRGVVYTGLIDKNRFVKKHLVSKKEQIKVAIKIKKAESEAVGRIENEARWLKLLNIHRIGPRLMFLGENYLAYQFVEGEFILDWLKKTEKKEIIDVLEQVLKQCYEIDRLGVNKEEMHHPLKHIIIDNNNKATLIDFERCNKAEKPHNVTQFVEFITRMKKELLKKDINIDIGLFRELAKKYKDNRTRDNFELLLIKLRMAF